MKIIDDNTVVVSDSLELKTVLEQDNTYNYIYFDSDISLENSITIHQNKDNVVIDGTYLDTKHTYLVNYSDETYSILVGATNANISVKNMNVTCCNTKGIVAAENSSNYSKVTICYDNITFNGVQMGYNPYGKFIITNCNVNIQDTNGVTCAEAFEGSYIELGGTTSIISNATNFPLFIFITNIFSTFKILPYSKISLRSENKEFLNGTYRLDFKILHDAEVNLVTGNGFAAYTIHGATNVLIDERASFTFIETKHQRVPMWTIYGTLTINEGANLSIINTYTKTPSDNYNIHFKGNNCKIILNDPNSILIYTPNANVLYTNNPLSFEFKIKRINMWANSTEFSMAGDINNLPNFSWYKKDGLLEINGTLSSNDTTITSHNLSESELASLQDLSNFVFQGRKQLSIGNGYMNIHPITNTSTKISGHTLPFADILIKYTDTEEIVNADDTGLFEYILSNSIEDNTNVEITSCVSGTFIYTTRDVLTPHIGELSIMSASNTIAFSLLPIMLNPTILPKTKEDVITIVDSRINSSNWQLYISIATPMASVNGFNLPNAVLFKKLNNEIITITDQPTLVFEGTTNGNDTLLHTVTWSTEKGVLLSLENNALEINEDYSAHIIWEIRE